MVMMDLPRNLEVNPLSVAKAQSFGEPAYSHFVLIQTGAGILFLLTPRLVFIKGSETNTVNHFGDGFWALVHKKAKGCPTKISMVLF